MVVITAACLVWVRWVWQLVGFMVLLLGITGAISGLMYGWDAASAEATKMWDSFSSGSHGIY